MTERAHNPSQPNFMGDEIIPNPTVAWDTAVRVPRDAQQTWALISHLGLKAEQGAGYFLPQIIEDRLPDAIRSIGALGVAGTHRQRQVGDRLRDVAKGSYAEVVAIDDAERTLVLDSYWPATKKRPNGLHYSWMLKVDPSPDQNGSILQTRIRIENHSKKHMLRVLGPRLDQWAMNMIARGLTERTPGDDISTELGQGTKVDRLVATMLGGAALATRVAKRFKNSPASA